MVPGVDDCGMSVVSNSHSPESFDPADGSLDHPSLSSELAAVPFFATTNQRRDSEGSQKVTGSFAVVSGIGIERCWVQTRSTWLASDGRVFHNGRKNLTVVADVGSGGLHYQRSPFCIDKDCLFDTGFSAVNRKDSDHCDNHRRKLAPGRNQS